jgi:hypothetical protein
MIDGEPRVGMAIDQRQDVDRQIVASARARDPVGRPEHGSPPQDFAEGVTAGLQQGLTQYSIEPASVPQPCRMPCQDRRRRPGIAILRRMSRMDGE